MEKDTLKLNGTFSLRVIKDGEVIETYEDKNLVVAVGRSQVAAMIGGATTDKFVSALQLGTNGTAPASSDTSITSPYSVAVTPTYPAPGEVLFSWVLGVLENNGVTIAEYGLVCDDGVLFARKTRATINKDNTIRLEGSWKITF